MVAPQKSSVPAWQPPEVGRGLAMVCWTWLSWHYSLSNPLSRLPSPGMLSTLSVPKIFSREGYSR